MSRFRKKPVVVEAFQWTGDEHQTEDPTWMCDAIRDARVTFLSAGAPEVQLAIATPEGAMLANPGDWIIRGTAGELYPCKPDIFATIYEPVQ